MTRTYVPNAIINNPEPKEDRNIWFISPFTSGKYGSMRRGPFIHEEEALACVGEDGDFIFKAYSIHSKKCPWPIWKWKEFYWKELKQVKPKEENMIQIWIAGYNIMEFNNGLRGVAAPLDR